MASWRWTRITGITAFVEKPVDPPAVAGKPDRSLCSMGVYIFNAKYLYSELMRDTADPTSSHDFGEEHHSRAVKSGCAMAHSFDRSCVHAPDESPDKEDYWRDVGTVNAYWEADIDLTAKDPALNLYDANWPVWTYQQQLPPAKFVHNRRSAAAPPLNRWCRADTSDFPERSTTPCCTPPAGSLLCPDRLVSAPA